NVGEGMVQSLNDFSVAQTVAPMFGTADTIALGAVIAVQACGGPFIPFRAGRVDASEAGPPTVPQPQQDLATHTELFRQQGFNATEMIALVHVDILLGDVSQYLQNTTENVLVVGPNVTTRSDLRIFSSDGNETMQSLLNPDTFTQTCGDLIERMINTVPNEYNSPVKAAPDDDCIGYESEPKCHTNTVMGRQTGIVLPIHWMLRGIIWVSAQFTAKRYSFNATINGATSISKFWFEINNNDGTDPITVDNGGDGFVIEQDSVFIDNSRSEMILLSTSFQEFNRLVVAVRGDATSTASIIAFDPKSTDTAPPFFPVITTVNLVLDETNPPDNGFIFLTGNVTTTTNFLNISATSDGKTYTQMNFDMRAVDFLFVEI
ncbi:heme peroxidase, partial [Rhodocollybia butyracea]